MNEPPALLDPNVRCRVASMAKGKPSALGANVERFRIKRGWSQAELAERTNGAVTQPDVSRLERGDTQSPGAKKVQALATALGENVLALYEGMNILPLDVETSLNAFLLTSVAANIQPEAVAWLRQSGAALGALNDRLWVKLLDVYEDSQRNKAHGEKK